MRERVQRVVAGVIGVGAAVIAVGLIASDILGDEGVAKLRRFLFTAQVKAATPPKGMEGARDINFFFVVEKNGLTFNTGVRYASFADLQKGMEAERWCYTNAMPVGGLIRRIDLGKQKAKGRPVFNDLTKTAATEVRQLGLDPAALTALSRSACRFSMVWNGVMRG